MVVLARLDHPQGAGRMRVRGPDEDRLGRNAASARRSAGGRLDQAAEDEPAVDAHQRHPRAAVVETAARTLQGSWILRAYALP